MNNRTSLVIVILLLSSLLSPALKMETAKAQFGSVYIRADGSVDPPSAPISNVGNSYYTFTADLNGSLVIERSNIVIDGSGLAVKGTGYGEGVSVYYGNNVTVKRLAITTFYYGVYLLGSANITVNDNNITVYSTGLFADQSSFNTILRNNITAISPNVFAVCLFSSTNNTFANNSLNGVVYLVDSGNNTIMHNHFIAGNYLVNSGGNIYRDNSLSGNFSVRGNYLSDFLNDIDTSNTIDSKPIYYWVNATNQTVPSDAGMVFLVNCKHAIVQNLNLVKSRISLAFTSYSTIQDNTLTDCVYGIELYNSSHNEIRDNIVSNNGYTGVDLSVSESNIVSQNRLTNCSNFGVVLNSASNNIITLNSLTDSEIGFNVQNSYNNSIAQNNIVGSPRLGFYLYYSSYNSIVENRIADNFVGLFFSGSNNKIFHNNFINNTNHAMCWSSGSANSWDNGYPSGGNYWSNYNSTDDNHDGISDTPYVIDSNNRDNYPLMQPWTTPTLADFNYTFRANPASIIYPANNATKPLNCGAAMVSDWLASMAVTTKLTQFTEGYDTDSAFVNPASGKPLGLSGNGVVTFGGPLVNPAVRYSELDSTQSADRAPIRFQDGGSGMLFFQFWNRTIIPSAFMLASTINHEEDMFVIEVYRDGDGKNIMLSYGMGWQGTYAAGKYFDRVIYPNLAAYNVNWVIVKWQDTNGDGFVNNPGDGDTYTQIASGKDPVPRT
ncbi:MAG: nitrous oxide reductase family maturation protein NosD [Candidatus Bathyarchaeia archaeon]